MGSRSRIKAGGTWVGLLESTYALEGDSLGWMNTILSCLPKEFDISGTAAYSFDVKPSAIVVKDVAVKGKPQQADQIRELVSNASTGAADLIFRSGQIVATLSEYLWQDFSGHEDLYRRVDGAPPDMLGIVAHSGEGQGVVLCLPLAAPRPSTAAEQRSWKRCAAHFGAALRLRNLLPQLESFDDAAIEAIFDAQGKLHDARNGATDGTSRQVLREAVCRIDRARSSEGRSDPDAALQNWEALVRGRWSLIDKFDSDHRRYVVAVRNDPQFPDPRGLSLQERQVSEYVGLGHSGKDISYILGVPLASAANCARRAQSKLGLQSRAELASFFHPQGVRARLAEAMVDGNALLIASAPAFNDKRIAELTTAERSILSLIVAGSSNADMARRRGSSVHTVANQVQAIFRKFGAHSRCDLIARIASSEPPSPSPQ